jgi:phospholipase/carboxylesterase
MLMHVVVHPGGDGPLPTVIALHGHGANAQELAALEPHLARGRALFIAPQGEYQLRPDVYGFTWLHRDSQGQRASDVPARAIASLRAFIDDAVARYPIDPERIVLLGFSMGAALAWSLTLVEPSRYAGVVVLSGYLSEETSLGLEIGLGLEGLPMLVQHGRHDQVAEITHVEAMVTQLRDKGAQIDLQVYEMGHEMNVDSVRALSAWLASTLRV